MDAPRKAPPLGLVSGPALPQKMGTSLSFCVEIKVAPHPSWIGWGGGIGGGEVRGKQNSFAFPYLMWRFND